MNTPEDTITINTNGMEEKEKNTPEFYRLEREIFPQRPSKRVHIDELQDAWQGYLRELLAHDMDEIEELAKKAREPKGWRRAWGWIRRAGR